jgi:integrase
MDELEKYLNNHSDWSLNTREHYKRILTHWLSETKDSQTFTSSDFLKWLTCHSWSSPTQWVAFCCVRGYITWLYGARHPALELKTRRVDSPPQRSLTFKQVYLLLSSFDTSTVKGIRDLAICSLLLDSGLRASECCRLNLQYLNLEEHRLTVLIKGETWGDGVYSEETSRFLSDWLAIRKARIGVTSVFTSIGGDTRGCPLTREGLQYIVSNWATRAEIKVLSPHDLRRTFASQATRLKCPARILQVAGRWKNLAMVERYTRDIEAEDFAPFFPVSNALA